MRKYFYLAALLAITINAGAQTTLSTFVEGSYGFPFATKKVKSEEKYNATVTADNQTFSYQYKMKRYSLGSGLTFNAGVRWWFLPGLGVEGGGGFLQKETPVYHGDEVITYHWTNGTLTEQYEYDLREGVTSHRFFIGFITTIPVIGKFSAQFRAGGVAGIKNTFYQDRTSSESHVYVDARGNATTTESFSEIRVVYNKGVAWGGYTAIGLNYALEETVSVGISALCYIQNYSPNHGEITIYKINGVDQLADMPVYDKEAEFVDEAYLDKQPDETKPQQLPRFYVPFNSLGVNVSVAWRFGGI